MPPDHGAAAVHIVLEDPELARALAGRARPRCATGSIRSASGSPPPTRGWRSSAGSSACSRCFRCRKEQVLKLRDDHAIYMADSGRFNVVGMGDDADRPIYRRRGRGDGRADHGRPRPGQGVRRSGLARGREAGADQPRDGPDRGRGARSGEEGPLPVLARAATTWRRCCSGCSSRMATACSAITARGRCCWRSAFRWPTRSGPGWGWPGGYSDGRDIGVVFNYPNPGGAHALPMCGGVGAQYTPAAGWAQAIAYKQQVLKRRAGRRDRVGARRRRELRDGRILVCANNCHDATIAAAHLHRGQWLRHLGAVGISDAGQGHRRQPRELRRADDLQRRRHRSRVEAATADRRGGRPCPRAARAGAAAADRAAARRP